MLCYCCCAVKSFSVYQLDLDLNQDLTIGAKCVRFRTDLLDLSAHPTMTFLDSRMHIAATAVTLSRVLGPGLCGATDRRRASCILGVQTGDFLLVCGG